MVASYMVPYCLFVCFFYALYSTMAAITKFILHYVLFLMDKHCKNKGGNFTPQLVCLYNYGGLNFGDITTKYKILMI